MATDRRLTIALVGLLWLGDATARLALAQDRPGGADSLDLRDNVVAIEAIKQDGTTDFGFGFIVGARNGDEFFVATANHVVRAHEREAVPPPTNPSEMPTPTRLLLRLHQAQGQPPIEGQLLGVYDKNLDLAVITAPLPKDITWHKDIVDEPSRDKRRTEVWFIGRTNDLWYVPAQSGAIYKYDVSIQRIIAEGLETRTGTSGAPLISADGIVGMVVEHNEQYDQTLATPIGLIKAMFEDWNLPWELTPFGERQAEHAVAPDTRADAWAAAEKRNTFAAYQDFLDHYCRNSGEPFCAEAGEALTEQERRVPRGVTDCDRYAASPTDYGRVARGVKPEDLDLERAFEACERVAIDTDNPRLMYQFGRVLDEKGHYETAAVWFMSAADKDYPAAHIALAVLYAGGDGVRKDDAKALEWLKKAARQYDDPAAQVRLGRVYRDGLLGTRSPGEAHRWFQEAAEHGHPEAQMALGRLYEEGVGVRLDSARAKHWYEKAAAQGYVEAQERLQELSGG